MLTFFGTATFGYDDSARQGTLDAVGADRRETSRARAQIEFAVSGGPSESESVVSLRGNVSFAGALAQFASEGGVYVGEELLDQFGTRLAEELASAKVTDTASAPRSSRSSRSCQIWRPTGGRSLCPAGEGRREAAA